MSTVAGLTSLGTDRGYSREKEGRSNQRRVQQATQSLRPAASPVSTYQTVEQPQQSDLSKFFNALQQIKPDIQNWGERYEQEQRDSAELEAQRAMNEMTFEEAQEAVQSGNLPQVNNPYFRAAFQRLYGTRLGLKRGEELTVAYMNDFDKRNGDIEEFLATYAREDLDGFGSDFLVSGYNDAFSPIADRLRQQHAGNVAQLIKQDTLDGVYETMMGIVNIGVSEGLELSQIANEITNQGREYKEIMNISFAELDDIRLSVAEQLARDGKLDLVKTLLEDDRGGVGSIAGKRGEQGARAASIIGLAEREHNQLRIQETLDKRLDFWEDATKGRLNEQRLLDFYRENPDTMTEEHLRSLISNNRRVQDQLRKEALAAQQQANLQFALEQDERTRMERNLNLFIQGKLPVVEATPRLAVRGGELVEETMSPEQQINEVVEGYLNIYSARIQEKYEETDEQRRLREVEFLSKNGLDHPVIKRMFNAGYSAASSLGISEGHDNAPPMTREAVQLYSSLRSINPRYATSQINQANERDFFETNYILQNVMGLETDEAITASIAATRDTNLRHSPFVRTNLERLNSEVNKLSSGRMWATITGGKIKPNNLPEVQEHVLNLSDTLIRTGMLEASEAVKTAAKFVADASIVVNGNWILETGIPDPDNFANHAETWLALYAEENDLSINNLSFHMYDNGMVATIWDKENMQPLATVNSVQLLKDVEDSYARDRADGVTSLRVSHSIGTTQDNVKRELEEEGVFDNLGVPRNNNQSNDPYFFLNQ